MASGARVAVVGGGIIGMSVAWRLAQGGASVVVFDAGRIGNEASWSGAGMLAPGGEFDERSLWSDLALESLSLYPGFAEELTHESGIPIDFRKCGAFDVAVTVSEAEALRARAARQTAIGIYSEQFPPSRVPGLRPDAIAAQYFPNDAVVNPRDILRALRIACSRAGAEMREGSPVRSIPLPQAPGEAGFDRVVLAAGAWSDQVEVRVGRERAVLPKSPPVRGHLVAFEEHMGLCDSIVRHGHTYLLRRAHDLVIGGASTEHVGFDRTINGAIAAEIARKAGEVIPQLKDCSYMTWNGFRPGSVSGEPVMGRVANAPVWLAYGHYRNGILLAPGTARGMARDILASDPMPASSQKGWFSPTARQR